MEFKIKKTISSLAVCMLVFVSFSAVMVYAPRPEDGGIPFQNVIVANEDPIPVEVTNPLDELLNVAVPEGVDVNNFPAFPTEMDVEVTNTEGLTLDVSGWKHTTSLKVFDDVLDLFPGVYPPVTGRGTYIYDIEGYKEITIYIESSDSDAVAAGLLVDLIFFITEGEIADAVQGPGDWIPITEMRTTITYTVIGNVAFIQLSNPSALTVDDLTVGYYLTT